MFPLCLVLHWMDHYHRPSSPHTHLVFFSLNELEDTQQELQTQIHSSGLQAMCICQRNLFKHCVLHSRVVFRLYPGVALPVSGVSFATCCLNHLQRPPGLMPGINCCCRKNSLPYSHSFQSLKDVFTLLSTDQEFFLKSRYWFFL